MSKIIISLLIMALLKIKIKFKTE